MNSVFRSVLMHAFVTALAALVVTSAFGQAWPDSSFVPVAARSFDEPINPERYLIRPGERFEIVFLNSSLPNLILTANPEGQVVHSGLGVVDLSGMTLMQAREVLTAALKPLFKADRIVVSVASIYAVPIQVSGMVNRPGTYYGYTSQHVSEIIDSAGGIAPGGSSRRIVFWGGPKELQIDLDMARYGEGRLRTNSFLYAGRRVVVPEITEAPVTVAGQVAQPRAIELLPGEGLDDLVMLWGGTRAGADLERAYAVNDPARNIHQPGGILPGDQIVVPSSAQATIENDVILTGAVMQSGRKVAVGTGLTLESLIEAAGGYQPTANPDRVVIFRVAAEEGATALPNRRYPLSVSSDMISSIALQASDSVHVPVKLGYVEVVGEVARPGLYPALGNASVETYVSMAGGYTAERATVALEVYDHVSGLTRVVSPRSSVFDGDRLMVKAVESPGDR